MSSFLYMGGYAAYVWPSIGLTLAVLAWNVLAARRAHVRARSHALARAARKAAP
ncbi:MAG TPA: heme exporter protein CcmD [Steroidobacteraceae bacterium]|nr:heme exporter protein CcmD [Steroidobacteraceae bacterium]